MDNSWFKVLSEFDYIIEQEIFIGNFQKEKTIISIGNKLPECLFDKYDGYLLYKAFISKDNKYECAFYGRIIKQEKKFKQVCLTEVNARSRLLREYLNRYISKATIYIYCPMQEWNNANHGNIDYKDKSFDIYNLSDLITICESHVKDPVFIYISNKKYRMRPKEILDYIKEHRNNWESTILNYIIDKLKGETFNVDR